MKRSNLVLLFTVTIVSTALSYYATSSYYTFIFRSLEDEYLDIAVQSARLADIVRRLNESLNQVITMSQKYCCLPRLFPEILNKDEIVALKWYIVKVGIDPNDEWTTIERVYSWITKNIKYVGDPEIIVPGNKIVCVFINSDQYCFYEFRELREYIQSPTETIKRGGGDCEDHAILVYAMFYYYFRYIRKANYTFWIALMSFGDGSKHASVFVPTRDGGLLVIDTSTGYITSVNGIVVSKPIKEELEEYSNLFVKNEGISRINLYSIDVENGSYNLMVSGGLATIASYIEMYVTENLNHVIAPRE